MEILVVIAITAVMLITMLPKVSSWIEKNRLLGVARAITNDLQFCRQQAISSNANCTITLSTAIPIVYTLDYTDKGAATSRTITLPESDAFHAFEISGGLTSFYFTYRGMANTSATLTITNGNDEVRTVTVSLAGKIAMS